jgi:hypothetical protein
VVRLVGKVERKSDGTSPPKIGFHLNFQTSNVKIYVQNGQLTQQLIA